MKEMSMMQQLYPKIDNIAMDAFELVFTIKCERVAETVTLTQVIERIRSRLQFADDTTTLILNMRKKEYGY